VPFGCVFFINVKILDVEEQKMVDQGLFFNKYSQRKKEISNDEKDMDVFKICIYIKVIFTMPRF